MYEAEENPAAAVTCSVTDLINAPLSAAAAQRSDVFPVTAGSTVQMHHLTKDKFKSRKNTKVPPRRAEQLTRQRRTTRPGSGEKGPQARQPGTRAGRSRDERLPLQACDSQGALLLGQRRLTSYVDVARAGYCQEAAGSCDPGRERGGSTALTVLGLSRCVISSSRLEHKERGIKFISFLQVCSFVL